MELPISPEKQKALDKAQELRNKAGEEAKLRGECFEKSKKEFESGDKGKAKELSDEGKEHGAKMEEFNRQAAEAFFNAHNMGNDLYTIDLHGLYVEEAVERVKERFEKIGRKGTLVVIWGAGNHSEGGVRKIKPAILEILNSEKLVFDDDVPNHGCCTVYFSGKTAEPAKPAEKPVSQPTAQPVAQPVAQPMPQPATAPAAQSAETKRACSCCCVM